MSWKETNCPICGSNEFYLDCDEVDIGIGILEGNFRGMCKQCGEVYPCSFCGIWLSQDSDHQVCISKLEVL
jgi:hypothetical protein